MVVRIAVVCADVHRPHFQKGIERFSRRHMTQARIFRDNRCLLEVLQKDSAWNLAVVALPGARGMETVFSIRELSPEMPVLWCSDDTDFAVASYRLQCSLFLPLPLTEEDVEAALCRCASPQPRPLSKHG